MLLFSYHWRSLFVRRGSTVLTMLVVGAVVGTLAWLLGFAGALRDSLKVAQDERKLIVIARGATSESTSALPMEEFNKLSQVTDVARAADGAALLSPEMLVQVSLPRRRDGGRTEANVAVRGVTDVALQVHPAVRLLGPFFEPGGREVVVGRRAAEQFAGLNVGDTIQLGFGQDRAYRVVGHFAADGGPVESEIWGYLPSLLNAYNRTMYSAAALRIADGADVQRVLEQIRRPPIELTVETERSYWEKQSANAQAYLAIVTVLVTIMAIAAVLSIANTMFAAVAGRVREIAMLRTIGYSRGRILRGFVLEAVLLALLGGVAGCLACAGWLAAAGSAKDMYGRTSFTTMAFEIRLTPGVIFTALALVALVGAFGALAPAWRAARVQMITALREG